jgi:hypothetical protein
MDDHDDIVRSHFESSIIVQRRITRTPRAGFDCVLHGREGHSYIVQLLFDQCEDAKLTDKNCVEHWIAGDRWGRLSSCYPITAPDANPVDSAGLGLRCILCHRGGHERGRRPLSAMKNAVESSHDRPRDSRRLPPWSGYNCRNRIVRFFYLFDYGADWNSSNGDGTFGGSRPHRPYHYSITAQTRITRTVMAQLVFDSTASCISEGYDHIVQLSLNCVVDTNCNTSVVLSIYPR